jgi:thiamine-phosphate pyrophosphorylase
MFRDQPRPVSPARNVSSLPTIWLFTDPRNDDRLEQAIFCLPRGSGIVFRHYHLPEDLRRERFMTVKKLARRSGHMVFLAGSPALAKLWRADGVHGRMTSRTASGQLIHSVPVHNSKEIHQANRAGAEVFFLSPIFSTRSHPGQSPLNPAQVRQLAHLCDGAVIFLGGMNRHRYQARKAQLAHGWAAIDAFV